jgi:beta-lactamase regulating signal transducer with metallopeptidase domain
MNDWVHIAGWVLLHFLWQGSLVAIVAAAALRLCRVGSSNLRYVVACLALSAMLAAPLLTAFVLVSDSAPTAFGSGSAFADAGSSAAAGGRTFELVSIVQEGITKTTGVTTLEAYFPLIVSVWLAGVALLLVHAFHGWYQIRRLHQAALAWVPSSWQLPANRLAQRLRLRRRVRVVEFAAVDVPTVLGWLRPVIILPVAAITLLSVAQVEAVLAHELAHVRRHDYLVNLLQRVAEAVLFYHPAIWWISARVREEREHCCDDLAIEICGDRDDYATALAELESRRTAAPVLGLAATDGPLLTRIRRILQVAGPDRIQTPNWTLTLALAAAFALLVGGPQRSPTLLAQATTSVAHALTPGFGAGWDDVMGSGSITSTGKVVFTDDLRDVKSVSSGGSLTVQTHRRMLSSRRVEISATDGSVNRKYFVNNSEQPWNEESARWLADELPFLVRRSGVSADERVRQIAEAKGVNAVLDEIRLLYTDSVRGLYFRALFGTRRMGAPDVKVAFRVAADLISSSSELGRTLDAALTAGLQDNDDFFRAASRISSSAEKSRLLTEVLDKSELTSARQVDFLTSAATIESNAGCAAVLDAFAARYRVADGPVRNAFLGALKTVDSDSERGRLLERIMADAR